MPHGIMYHYYLWSGLGRVFKITARTYEITVIYILKFLREILATTFGRTSLPVLSVDNSPL